MSPTQSPEATSPSKGQSPQTSDAAVPYQSLYRRFRPQQFSEVRGQDHVTHTLRNAVATDRVAHAYLFSGPRGTGKTSTARILAKALNCTESTDGEPCGHCESCRSIVAGSSFDVHELDAASNNGVEAMRDLVARASLANPGRWKVYIVDEVHMLSTAASNALLKTLEEPPDHVIFVLATTDPQKVLLTIRSRTQHFEFHLLNEDVLESLLNDVAESAALSLPDGAIDVARKRGKGSARDALSALDQVATAGVVDDDSDSLARIIASLASANTAEAIGALDEALHNGRDPYQVAIELVERMRVGFLALVAPNARLADSGLVGTEAAEAKAIGAPRCVRAMEVIGNAIVAMRDAPDPRITIEVALIRLTHPEAEDTTDALLDRIDRLERRIEQLGSTAASSMPESLPVPPPPLQRTASAAPPGHKAEQAATATPSTVTPNTTPEVSSNSGTPPRSRPSLGAYRQPPTKTEAAPSPAAPQSTPAQPQTPAAPVTPDSSVPMPTRDAIVTAWGDQLLVGLRPKVRAIYQIGRFVGVEDDTVILALPNEAHILHAEPLRTEVVTVLNQHFGRTVNVRLVADGPQYKGSSPSSSPSTEDDATESGVHDVASSVVAVEEDEVDFSNVAEGGTADPKLGLAWAEDKLLQAFPGAEEVESA